jgi:hypothetical protein
MADTTSDRYLAIAICRSWAKLVITGLTDALCLREPFAGPRPETSYVGVEWVSSAGASLPYLQHTTVSDVPNYKPSHPKIAVLQIHAYGENASPWVDIMDRSRARHDVQALLQAAGFGVVRSTPITVGDIVRDGVRYEQGAVLEVALSYTSVDTSAVVGTPLEVVTVAATFDPGDIQTTITVDTTP